MSSRRGACGAAVVAALLGLAGCGGGLKTYPLQGKVVLDGGDVQELAGSHIEFMLESDPTLRSSGIIGPDGSFTTQTQHKGELRKGAPEGTYKARIILAEPEDGRPKRRASPVHNRFLDFKTSGLTVQVPADGDVTLTVARR